MNAGKSGRRCNRLSVLETASGQESRSNLLSCRGPNTTSKSSARATGLPFTAQLIVAAIGLTHNASVLVSQLVIEETAAWIKPQLANPSREELTRLVRKGRSRGADTQLAMDEDWSMCGATAKPYPVVTVEPAVESWRNLDNAPCSPCQIGDQGSQRLDEIVTDDCEVEQSGEALEADADSSDEEARREDHNSRPLPLEVCRWISGVGSDGVEALCRAMIELAGASDESFTWHKGLPVTVIGPLGLETTLQFFEAKHRRRIEGCDWTRRPTEPPPAPVKTLSSSRHLGGYTNTSAVTLCLSTLYQLALQRAGEPVAPAKRGWRDPLTGIFLSEAELMRSHVPGGVLKMSWGHAVHGWFMVDGFSSEVPTDISQFDPAAINTTLELWASNKWRKAYRSLRLGIMEQRNFLLAFLRRHGKVPQSLVDCLQESWDNGALPTLPTMSHELNVLWKNEQAIVWRHLVGGQEAATIPSPEASGFKIACPTTMKELTGLFASLVRIDLRTLPPVDSTWLTKIDRVRRS